MSRDWEKYGFIVASEYRTKIVLLLISGPKTPKKLANQTGLYLSHVSSTLTELCELNIARCLTPDLKKGRVYGLTDHGKAIAIKVQEEYG